MRRIFVGGTMILHGLLNSIVRFTGVYRMLAQLSSVKEMPKNGKGTRAARRGSLKKRRQKAAHRAKKTKSRS